MKYLLLASLLAAGLGACGSVEYAGDAGIDGSVDAGVEPSAVSGSRIKISYLETAEGARQIDGFFDSELGVSCYFGEVGGDLYCLPDIYAIDGFTDAECSQPIFSVYNNDCNALPTYIGAYTQGICNSTLDTVHRRGDMVTPVPYYQRDGAGTCNGPFDPDPNRTYYAVGDEVALSTFVAASVQPGTTTTTALETSYIVGEDGSRSLYSLTPRGSDVPCNFQYSDDGYTLVCLPRTADATYFRDASCTERVAQDSNVCNPETPTHALYYEPSGCPAPIHLLELGASASPDALYYDSGDTCSATTVNPDYDYYSLGEEVEIDSFPALTRLIDPSAPGRAKPYVFDSGDGLRFSSYGWHDSERDEDCYITQVGADYYCIPDTNVNAADAFSDAGCTTPILVGTHYIGGTCQREVSSAAIEYEQISDCVTEPHIYPVGAEIEPGTIYAGAPGSCFLIEWDPAQYEYYSLGAESALSSLPTFTRRTE
jgi:hypothetical protein